MTWLSVISLSRFLLKLMMGVLKGEIQAEGNKLIVFTTLHDLLHWERLNNIHIRHIPSFRIGYLTVCCQSAATLGTLSKISSLFRFFLSCASSPYWIRADVCP
jgi:hypothetical protein